MGPSGPAVRFPTPRPPPQGGGRDALVLVSVLFLAACGKTSGEASKAEVDAAPVYVSPDPAVEALWVRAAQDGGDGDDLARLADREGASGLAARGETDPGMRAVAVRALAFAPEPGMFEGLPLLAQVAGGKSDVEANAALDSAIDLAARPRRALDPDDAIELTKGCELLLALASDSSAARARRVKAIRALRMLADADKGAFDAGAIPTDLDAP